MSWFKRDSPLRASFGRRLPSKSKPPDPDACYESFKKHLQQAYSVINKYNVDEPTATNAAQLSVDDILIVLSNLDQMVTLLIQENLSLSHENGLRIGPMLDYLMTEGLLDKLFAWSLKTGEYCNQLKLEQLKIYEVLLSNSAHELLVHKPILRPLLNLLAACKECAPVEVEKRLIVLLNQLCVSLSQNPNLVEYFFSASSEQGSARFLIFSLLIPFVHREGGIGQQARDALLLCMSLSSKNENIGAYIADSSNFCPVLATGLSGLYSRLPRKLNIRSEDWCQLSSDDVQEVPELSMFMNSLEFCNAVVQVSHVKVQEQLLDYLYQGFLVPVLGPALHQSSIEEIETATAYLDLFIRNVSDPALVHSFLKFILTEEFDGQVVINTLIARINSHLRLSLITMSLFKTLLNLNSEDLMLELIFKYMLPCNHVMVSQRCRLRDNDIYSQATAKLFTLVPVCCGIHAKFSHISSPSSQCPIQSSQSEYSLYAATQKTKTIPLADVNNYSSNELDNLCKDKENRFENVATNYLNYLYDAQIAIENCTYACRAWSNKYDGVVSRDEKSCAKINDPSETNRKSATNLNCNTELRENGLSPDFWDVVASCKVDTYEDIEVSLEKLDALIQGGYCKPKEKISRRNTLSSPNETNDKSTPDWRAPERVSDNRDVRRKASRDSSFGSPDIGPFLGVLLTKLENMMNNSIYVNLQLTGLISRLAVYPQPLLRSFLLSHNLVFQPSIRSLIQILGSLKHKLDTFSGTASSFQDMLGRAFQFFHAREQKYILENSPTHKVSSHPDNNRTKFNNSSNDVNHRENRRRSISNFLFRRGSTMEGRNADTIKESILESIPDGQGYRYINRSSDVPEGKLEWLKTKNAVLCAIVLKEFVKELAAISQEHLIADAESNIDLKSIL